MKKSVAPGAIGVAGLRASSAAAGEGRHGAVNGDGAHDTVASVTDVEVTRGVEGKAFRVEKGRGGADTVESAAIGATCTAAASQRRYAARGCGNDAHKIVKKIGHIHAVAGTVDSDADRRVKCRCASNAVLAAGGDAASTASAS